MWTWYYEQSFLYFVNLVYSINIPWTKRTWHLPKKILAPHFDNIYYMNSTFGFSYFRFIVLPFYPSAKMTTFLLKPPIVRVWLLRRSHDIMVYFSIWIAREGIPLDHFDLIQGYLVFLSFYPIHSFEHISNISNTTYIKLIIGMV